MTKYIQNENGGIQSVTDEHFEHYLHTETNSGNRFLLAGYKEITEAQARKAHPQMFGAPDPQITLTDDELVRAANRKKLLAQIHSDAPAGHEAGSAAV